MKNHLSCLCGLLSAAVCLSLTFCTSEARASAFTAGDLVVVVVGTNGTLAAVTAATSLYEYNTTTANQASPINSIALPTTTSGHNPLTLSGSATSEGFLTLSADGRYLTMMGYNSVPGVASPSASTAVAMNRVIGRIDMLGNIDTTTALTDAYSGNTPRSAVSTDGTVFWTGGATLGTRYATLGATTSVQLSTALPSNVRVVNIYNGQLYVSSSSGAFVGPSTVGTGEPTTTGQTVTLLNGFPTSTTGHSPYDYWFKDSSTLYVADDGSAANSGGIQKWTLSAAGLWSLQYTLLNNGTTNIPCRGLAGTVDGSGNAVLFATTAVASTANTLITVTDTGAASASYNLATAPVGDAFRGVELVPEPASAILMGLGVLGLVFWHRRK